MTKVLVIDEMLKQHPGIPTKPLYIVHSMNPVAAHNIIRLLDSIGARAKRIPFSSM